VFNEPLPGAPWKVLIHDCAGLHPAVNKKRPDGEGPSRGRAKSTHLHYARTLMFQSKAELYTVNDLAVMGQHDIVQVIGEDGYSMCLGSYPLMHEINSSFQAHTRGAWHTNNPVVRTGQG
jgi:hypothetical protein